MKDRMGTASNIEIKRWVTESEMLNKDYPVFAACEDEDGKVIEKFTIIGCRTDGEIMSLRLRKNKNNNIKCYNCKKIISYTKEDIENGYIICPDCGTQLYLLD